MIHALLLLYIALNPGATHAQSLCYFANGTALPESPGYNEYIPCTSEPTTICCGLNRADPPGGNRTKGFTKDECLPNGLCRNRWVNSNNAETISYWNNFCTEKDVTSSKCLNVCASSRLDFGHARLTPCNGRADSERWCCGTSLDCCSSNTGVISLAQVLGGTLFSSVAGSTAPTTISTSRSNSVSTALVSTSGSATGTEAPDNSNTPLPDRSSSKSGLSTGAIAGIAVGVIVGVGLLGAALFYARRSKTYKQTAKALNLAEAPEGHPPCYEAQDHEVIAEKEAYAHRSELPGAPPAELPSEEVPRTSRNPM